mgnify:CR=1 FL=1
MKGVCGIPARSRSPDTDGVNPNHDDPNRLQTVPQDPWSERQARSAFKPQEIRNRASGRLDVLVPEAHRGTRDILVDM